MNRMIATTAVLAAAVVTLAGCAGTTPTGTLPQLGIASSSPPGPACPTALPAAVSSTTASSL
ncbi:MAG TPA: hypothetical protein VFX16_26505, partial [Pseudonocardiaceae bacterium]|nr:hypothetical protein [Pseudonocardiaceae bacterium]